ARASAARERARLVDALTAAPPASSAQKRVPARPRAPRPAWAAALLVPAALGAWLILRSSGPGAGVPDAGPITWRGATADPAAAPAALLVFAAARAEGATPTHVRLVADLPASGEGRVSRHDFVQF